ncbi:tetratricopeptide repeat protein [bacterium]|nr:tetratricopeptide repeat protein [bacterium]
MTCSGIPDPTSARRGWGLLVPPLLLAALLGAGGCAGRRPAPCAERPPTTYVADEDSLGLAAFLALPDAAQERRLRLAAAEQRAADRADRPDQRLRHLIAAAGLAPSDPEPWLDQARVWRWVGDYLRTNACLDAAAAAVRAWDPDSPLARSRPAAAKADATLETALLNAWLHYDRAEWREARQWVRAAQRVEAGNTAVLRLRGLVEASLGSMGMAEDMARDLRRRDPFTTDVPWITSRIDTARGRHRAAYNSVYDLRPDEAHAAECYRDMGRAAEQVGDFSTASKWYRESLAALPLTANDCLRQVAHGRISDAAGRHPLPFWLAFGRYYVTGSLSAYLGYAFERFESAATDAEREEWGGLAVNAAGICVRLEMEKPEARRLRGLVFAGTGRNDRAIDDLRAAAEGFPVGAPELPGLEAEIGHLYLLNEDHVRAEEHLARALALDSEVARTWSDMGLVHVMARDEAAATAAFDQALALDPALTIAWYNRGLMRLHAGDLEGAEADLGRAAALAPENAEIGRLLQQVALKRRQGER